MSKIYIDGTEVDLDIRRPGVGSVVSAYGTGRRVILTVPTFEKFHQGTPKKFARLMASQTSPWHCVAVSLDYPPILSQWATITGWEGQPFQHLLGDPFALDSKVKRSSPWDRASSLTLNINASFD